MPFILAFLSATCFMFAAIFPVCDFLIGPGVIAGILAVVTQIDISAQEIIKAINRR
ncbi:MAG: hypothetical protein V1846_04460 [Candidatus Komeilibacteria bacterium]